MAYIGPSPTLPGSVNTTDIEDSAVTAIKLGANNQPGSSGQLLSTDGSGGLSWAADAGMVYPGAGIPLSTGSAWGTSFTAPSSALVGLTDTQTLTNKTLTAPIINSLSSLSVVNNVVVGGDLTVNGTTTTIDSQTLSVKDKNIEMGVVSSPSDATADGGGLTLKGATDKTFNWIDSTDAWTSSEHIKLASGKTFIGDGSTLTALNASNISSGTIAAARVPTLNQNTTGTSGGFTAGSASNLNSGTVPIARLGSSGSASSSTFLRGDNSWQTITGTTINNNNNNRIITGSSTQDTLEAEATLTYNGSSLDFNTSTDTKIHLRGTDDPEIKFYESNTQKMFLAWRTGGYAYLHNYEHSTSIKVGSDFSWYDGSSDQTIVHQGNVGSGGALSSKNVYASEFHGNGANLTTLNASNISSGTVATARLGSGTASSSTFLRGDNSWQTITTGVTSDAQYNTVGGTSAGAALNSTSLRNTLFGYQAGTALTDSGSSNQANDNTAVGYQALKTANGSWAVQNTAIGRRALYSSTTAQDNTAIGYGSLYTLTTGNGNTVVGLNSAYYITTGAYNVTLGQNVATNLTTGSYNLILGNGAQPSSATVSNEITLGGTSFTKFRIPGINFVLKDNGGNPTTGQVLTADGSGEGYWAAVSISSTSGNTLGGTDAGSAVSASATDNTFFGYQSGKVTNTGDENTAIGHNSLLDNTSGSRNVAIGKEAGFENTTGTQNTFVGFGAGYENTSGNYNTALGGFSLALSASALSGDYNTCLGYYAGAVITGEKNTCVGAESGKAITNTYGNVHIGYQAGMAVTTGTNNVCIGHRAGEYGVQLTTGYKNIIIGPYASASSATVDNEVTIGQNTITKFRIPGINFILKDNGGTPSSGQVLTADGSGEGYWATPAASGGTTLNTTSNNLYSSISGNSNGGTYNISLGKEAGNSLASGGNYNTLLGYQSGKDLSTGSYNILLGNGVAEHITTGMRNIGIGPFCMMDSTITGTDNVAIGNSALRQLTSGTYNTAIGPSAGYYLTTASNNTFIGRSAGNNVTTGATNSCFGAFAGQKITTSAYNTCLGGQAGMELTTGANNTCIGYNSGYNGTTDLTTGSNNILIGYGVTSSSATVSNEITLGDTNITKFRIPGINFELADNGGTPANGTVLTMASGGATWAAAGGGGGTILNTTSNNLYTSQSGNSNGGTYNISLGKTSGNSLASGSGNNVFLGREAGKGVTTANSNIGIGWYAFANYSTCTGDNNIGMGYATLGYLTSGVYNTAIGNRALLNVTTGNHNNCIGWYAGTDITTSSWNALFGDSAGQNITTGSANTCLGSQTGWNITTGGNNVCVGRDSGARTTTGSYNTFLGFRAGQENSTGSSNTCIGEEAGYGQSGSTNGSTNTFIGKRAGKDITTGYNNVGIGYDTLFKLTGGFHNVCIGDEAANKLTTGSRNIAIGDETMKNQTVTGTYNIYMGYQAGYNQVGSTKNVGIGYQALYSPSSGDNNIAIGEYAMWSNTGVTGNYNIGIGNTYNNLTSGTRNVCIGYQAGSSAGPSGEISTSSDNIVLGNNNIANLYCADTTISSSDSRDKTDVTNFTHGLDWVNKLNPITYRWDKRSWYNEYNEDNNIKTVGTPDGSKKRARQHIGFLAQDVLAIEQADGFASKKDDMLIVNLNEDDSAYGLKYERLVPVLVNAIKELSTEVTTLKTKVATLEAA